MWIVIADDHALLRELLREHLGRYEATDLEVSEVASYDELHALDVTAKTPTVILLDINIPGETGVSGVASVIQHFKNSKVLVMSGSANPQTARACIEQGAAGFIPKTVSGQSLRNTIRVVADGERYIHSFALEQFSEHLPTASNPVRGSGELPHFSDREREITDLLASGMSNKAIARQLGLQEMTVKTHLRNVYRKLGAQNRAEAVARILRGTRSAG